MRSTNPEPPRALAMDNNNKKLGKPDKMNSTTFCGVHLLLLLYIFFFILIGGREARRGAGSRDYIPSICGETPSICGVFLSIPLAFAENIPR